MKKTLRGKRYLRFRQTVQAGRNNKKVRKLNRLFRVLPGLLDGLSHEFLKMFDELNKTLKSMTETMMAMSGVARVYLSSDHSSSLPPSHGPDPSIPPPHIE